MLDARREAVQPVKNCSVLFVTTDLVFLPFRTVSRRPLSPERRQQIIDV